MSIKEFEKLVDTHSLCPNNVLYNSNAFVGEAGEVANQVKKREIAIIRPEWVTENESSLPSFSDFQKRVGDELGDALFYLVRLAHDSGLTMEELMFDQATKLGWKSNKYKRVFLK